MKCTLRIFALTAALCLLAGAWIKGARDGYRAGALEVGQSAYAAGRAEGIRLEAAALKRCMPWASWGKQHVVICQETRP